MGFGEVPKGLNDVKVAVLDTSDVPGTSVDVGGAQSLNFTVESDEQEVRGDDTIIAKVRGAKTITGSLAIARIQLTALAAMIGGAIVPGGSGTAETVTLDESDAAISRYFQLTGQANSYDVSGSAYRVILKKLSVTSGPSETLDQDAFDVPTIDFSGVGVAGVLMSRWNYETKVALT